MKVTFKNVAVNEAAVLVAVARELASARKKHGAFASAHEGYAVILEELDELWDEVKKKTSERSKKRMREEAIQIAAMGARFVVDVCS